MGRPVRQQRRPVLSPDDAITPAVLVVDDDPHAIKSTQLLLLRLGIEVHEAMTGEEAVRLARMQRLDLALLDQRLPDMSGLDVAKAFHRHGITVPWILMSGFMDFELAAEAGRLGAVRVVSLPFDVEDVVTRALAEIMSKVALPWPSPPLKPRLREPRSAAERWARFVLLACDAEADLPTIQDWASWLAVGYGTLRDSCDVVGVPGREARDFMRILRVLVRTGGKVDHLEVHLRFCDKRTLDLLQARSGLTRPISELSLEEFLARQRFIPSQGPAIEGLRTLTADL